MHILIAHFTYEGMTEQEFLATAKDLAPNFAAIPGCFEKTWLIDAAARTGGGVYKFRDRASIDDYLASELWGAVKSTPQFTNLTTEIHGVMEDATAITHGLPAVLAR
jgi:hypothetical protein